MSHGLFNLLERSTRIRFAVIYKNYFKRENEYTNGEKTIIYAYNMLGLKRANNNKNNNNDDDNKTNNDDNNNNNSSKIILKLKKINK